jgi:hypothetical protein
VCNISTSEEGDEVYLWPHIHDRFHGVKLDNTAQHPVHTLQPEAHTATTQQYL